MVGCCYPVAVRRPSGACQPQGRLTPPAPSYLARLAGLQFVAHDDWTWSIDRLR